MFEQTTTYPTAVASNDDDAIEQALAWCVDLMEPGDKLTIWTPQKSNLQANERLEELVRTAAAEHMTGRGNTAVRSLGPVLMAWPDMDNIGELNRSARRIRGLCVVVWVPDEIRPWVVATNATVLGNATLWQQAGPQLDPLVGAALEGMTAGINHNNTIAAGYEKDLVVAGLLALRAAGIGMNPTVMHGWALAHGWSGSNPQKLAQYVTDINNGKRPQSRYMHGPEYVQRLRDVVSGNLSGDTD